jgi:hypothetical protein
VLVGLYVSDWNLSLHVIERDTQGPLGNAISDIAYKHVINEFKSQGDICLLRHVVDVNHRPVGNPKRKV